MTHDVYAIRVCFKSLEERERDVILGCEMHCTRLTRQCYALFN